MTLRQVQCEETACTPADDERSELHDRKRHELPRQEEFSENVATKLLEGTPLLFVGLATAQERILVSWDVGEVRSSLLERKIVLDVFVAVLYSFSGACFESRGGKMGSARHKFATVEFGFREEEYDTDQCETKKSDVKPPEVTPADSICHRASYDGSHLQRSASEGSTGGLNTYHQGAKVPDKVQCVVLATVMEENDIGDDSWLLGLSRTGTKTVEPRGSRQ